MLFCCSVFFPLFSFLFFLNHFCLFVLFLFFILQLALLWFCILVLCFCLFSFYLILFLCSFVCLLVLLLFVLFSSVFVSFVSVCVFLSFCFCLFDFTFYHLPGVWLGVFCFFNPLYCWEERLVGSWFLEWESGLRLWGWEHQVQDAGPIENSWSQGRLIRELSRRPLSESRTWLHPTATAPSAGGLKPKKPDRNGNPPISTQTN